MASRNDSRGPNGPCTTGVVDRTIPDKGFGFIKAADSRDIFFHLSNCEAGLWEKLIAMPNGGKGHVVSFEPAKTEKGPRALQVQE